MLEDPQVFSKHIGYQSAVESHVLTVGSVRYEAEATTFSLALIRIACSYFPKDTSIRRSNGTSPFERAVGYRSATSRVTSQFPSITSPYPNQSQGLDYLSSERSLHVASYQINPQIYKPRVAKVGATLWSLTRLLERQYNQLHRTKQAQRSKFP